MVGDHPIIKPLIMATLAGGLVTGLVVAGPTVLPIIPMVFRHLGGRLRHHRRHKAADLVQHQVGTIFAKLKCFATP